MTEHADARTSGPGYAKHPNHRVELEACPKRVRVIFNDEVIADSAQVQLLRESRYTPTYYFPRSDIRQDLLVATDHSTYCPFKGTARYWSIATGGRTAENAVWGYDTPYAEVSALDQLAAFYWDRVDAWYEDDDQIFVHPTDPQVRIDIRATTCPVRVVLGETEIAATRDALILYETGLPRRYYLPRNDVRMDLLGDSPTATACPYKGTAGYYSVRIAGQEWPDIAWFYSEPLDECLRIKDRICFFNERVDAVEIDGIAEVRPRTKWSDRS